MKILEYASDNRSTAVDLTSSGANQMLAQSFQLKQSGTVGTVRLYLRKIGAPLGYLQVSIRADDGAGLPDTPLTNGDSNGLPMASVDTSWGYVDFTYDMDGRPEMDASTTYHLVLLASSSYSYTDGTTEIAWGADQSSPHFVDGEGETYNGTIWSDISTDTDFCFQVYTGERTDISYPSIRSVAHAVKQHTNSGTIDYSADSKLSPTEVYDYADQVSDQIDLWLQGAGFETPITDTMAKRMLRPYADAGTAMWCELTSNTASFRGAQGAGTRMGAFRTLYESLQEQLREGGEIVDAFVTLGIAREDTIKSARGLTAGGVEDSDRDSWDDDDTLIKPRFTRDMWDNE